ncbi:MAG TPA: carboxypeptidase-like regulatory domain-containing protein [Thermoanaerobaculia bacterium]
MQKLIAVLVLLVPLFAQASSEIGGRVVDAAGAPVAQATVHVYEAWPRVGVNTVCPSCYRDCGKQVATGDDGAFRLRELDDALVFRLLAVAEGYEPAFAGKVDPRDGTVTIAMKKRASEGILIRGRVVDPEGKLAGWAPRRSGRTRKDAS